MGDTDNAAQASSAEEEQQAAAATAQQPDSQPSTGTDDGGEVKPDITYEG